MCEFILEQLRKGYIRPLKSPQTAPVSFIGKKDDKKRMIQDYRYLNEWTIKNSYPLPLITDIVENIESRTYKVLGIGKLLSLIHQRFCNHSQTTA